MSRINLRRLFNDSNRINPIIQIAIHYPTRSKAADPPPRQEQNACDLAAKWRNIRAPLFPNSFVLFPNSFSLFPNSFGVIPELVWPYSRTPFPYSRTRLVLEASWKRLGGVMEASWAGKVANMAPTWPQVGAQNGGKIRLGPSWRRLGSLLEASCSRFYAFLMHFCCMP